MPTYRVSRELQSAAFFPVPYTRTGYTFLTIGGRDSGLVHVSGLAEGPEFWPALTEWEEQLRRVLDALAVAALVALSSYGGSVLAQKDGSSVAWFQQWEVQRDVVTITDLQPYVTAGFDEALQGFHEDEPARAAALHYRESLLYPSVLVAALHLLRALEALAGTVAHVPGCATCGKDLRCEHCGREPQWSRTDHRRLEEILGTPSYKFFYKKPGARNLLMHGAYVEQRELAEQIPILRKATQDALRSRLAIEGNPWLNRARGPFAHRAFRMWLDMGDREWDLAELVGVDLSYTTTPRMLTPPEIEALRDSY